MKYELTFATMRFLEENGVPIKDIGTKSFTFVAAMVAFEEKITLEEADVWVEEYVKNGNSFISLSREIMEEVTNSAFFQALIKTKGTPKKKPQDYKKKKKPQDYKKKKR